jgi:Mce-associated membrane protein
MSTTRHLINRQRRLAAVSASAQARTVPAARPRTTDADASSGAGVEAASAAESVYGGTAAADGDDAAAEPGTVEQARPRVRAGSVRRPSGTALVAAALALLTVLLGGFAAWAAARASDLRDPAATGNSALTDTARTSEVKGAVAQDVNAVFSYDYADTAKTDDAARRMLTGKAVQQYAAMLAQVRAQAPAQKLVLTTTVTGTGVQTIDGDRARVLVFADQRNTSTAAGSGGSTYAAAMFAVDAVRQDGTWKIAAIDTFG